MWKVEVTNLQCTITVGWVDDAPPGPPEPGPVPASTAGQDLSGRETPSPAAPAGMTPPRPTIQTRG